MPNQPCLWTTYVSILGVSIWLSFCKLSPWQIWLPIFSDTLFISGVKSLSTLLYTKAFTSQNQFAFGPGTDHGKSPTTLLVSFCVKAYKHGYLARHHLRHRNYDIYDMFWPKWEITVLEEYINKMLAFPEFLFVAPPHDLFSLIIRVRYFLSRRSSVCDCYRRDTPENAWTI